MLLDDLLSFGRCIFVIIKPLADSYRRWKLANSCCRDHFHLLWRFRESHWLRSRRFWLRRCNTRIWRSERFRFDTQLTQHEPNYSHQVLWRTTDWILGLRLMTEALSIPFLLKDIWVPTRLILLILNGSLTNCQKSENIVQQRTSDTKANKKTLHWQRQLTHDITKDTNGPIVLWHTEHHVAPVASLISVVGLLCVLRT